MHYFGGKARISKRLVAFIQPYCTNASMYWEPFCGACWVLHRIEHPRKIASDLNESLILMWQALQHGWKPPRTVSEEEYVALRRSPSSPLKAFVGFGCSFAGRWFEGYARGGEGRNYATSAANSLETKLAGCRNVQFIHGDYAQLYKQLNPEGAVIYCDPPYQGTKECRAVGHFDSTLFWNYMRDWSKANRVFVSEYAAPEDFVSVWEHATKTEIRGACGRLTRVEKLFRYQG